MQLWKHLIVAQLSEPRAGNSMPDSGKLTRRQVLRVGSGTAAGRNDAPRKKLSPVDA